MATLESPERQSAAGKRQATAGQWPTPDIVTTPNIVTTGSDDRDEWIPALEAIPDSESDEEEEKESLTSDTATSSCASCNFAYCIFSTLPLEMFNSRTI